MSISERCERCGGIQPPVPLWGRRWCSHFGKESHGSPKGYMRISRGPGDSTPRCLPKRTANACPHKNRVREWPQEHHLAGASTAKKWKWLHVHQQMTNKQNPEGGRLCGKTESLARATAWVTLGSTLCERSRSQRTL